MPRPDRPNLIFLFTDQQSATMMSCAGNRWLHTPAMDRLAAGGVRFDRAYCTDPVCVPSRFSLMTGRMPSAIGLRSNDSSHLPPIPEAITQHGLGWLLRRAGYETVYGGKVHLPKKLSPTDIGFDVIARDERDGLADACVEFIRRPHDRPYLLVGSFINPHDICYLAIRESQQDDKERWLVEHGRTEVATLDRALQRPDGVDEATFFAEHCPPVPPNFDPQADEPEAVRSLLARRPFRRRAREVWTERQWRLHRWAYARLTEFVDAQIARVLDAVEAAGAAENTVIVFSSDHGDHDGSHRMEHKTAFYEEACRIPLIIAQPGATAAGAVDAHLACNGLDLIPTLCDYAGVEPPTDLAGVSLRPLAEARPPGPWREQVHIESELGRCLVTDRYKYMRYDQGASAEQLMDLHTDPHETRNALADPEHQAALADLRRLFDGPG